MLWLVHFAIRQEMNKKEPLTRVYLAEAEYMSGFCPLCSKPVGIILSENSLELSGVCSECGNTLFYSSKLSALDVIEISNLDSYK